MELEAEVSETQVQATQPQGLPESSEGRGGKKGSDPILLGAGAGVGGVVLLTVGFQASDNQSLLF